MSNSSHYWCGRDCTVSSLTFSCTNSVPQCLENSLVSRPDIYPLVFHMLAWHSYKSSTRSPWDFIKSLPTSFIRNSQKCSSGSPPLLLLRWLSPRRPLLRQRPNLKLVNPSLETVNFFYATMINTACWHISGTYFNPGLGACGTYNTDADAIVAGMCSQVNPWELFNKLHSVSPPLWFVAVSYFMQQFREHRMLTYLVYSGATPNPNL